MGLLSVDIEKVGPDVWGVAELTTYIRDLFAIDYRLQDLQVMGEVSNFTEARSGHLYFTLKDDSAQLRCVMWRSAAARLKVVPQDGDAIIVGGRVSVYEAGGTYQLYADWLEPAGRGELALAFERLKEELQAEGLFEPTHKKTVPITPRKIGIVTSADAAALRDILNVLGRRWPLVEVLVAPTLVQGRDAPSQIVRALTWLDGRSDIDTIILARGGGSIEDLWAFNEESVARAIFEAEHPIITGIGHETDFTIADFVADQRAPTPSAAAELSVPDKTEAVAAVDAAKAALEARLQAILQQLFEKLWSLAKDLHLLSPRMSLDSNRQRVDGLFDRMDLAWTRYHERILNRLEVARAGLRTVSPRATLDRGYAVVRHIDGRIVRSANHVTAGDRLRVEVSEGEFGAIVDV